MGGCHRWPRSWVRGWAQQTHGIGWTMAYGLLALSRRASPGWLRRWRCRRPAGPRLQPLGGSPSGRGPGSASPGQGPGLQALLPQAALGLGAQAVLNCDLVPQGPAVLQIFFRIGPVQEFRYDSGKFPIGLNGPDRFCRGGSGHSGFDLKAGRHLSPFSRGKTATPLNSDNAKRLNHQEAKAPSSYALVAAVWLASSAQLPRLGWSRWVR